MEKLYDLSKFVELINLNIEFNDKCCNFLYTTEDNLSIEKLQEIKKALDYFIKSEFSENKVTFLTAEQIPHELNYSEKKDFFKNGYLHIIDCLNMNTNNFHKVASLYDCTKDLKTAFLYVNTPQTLRDYFMTSQQYNLRTYSFGDMDHDFIAFKRYYELMGKVENKPQNTNTKKKI